MTTTSIRSIPVMIAVISVTFVVANIAARTQNMSLSIPYVQTAAGERVFGFEIRTTSGRIAKIPNVPIGWNVSVNNDPSWNSEIKASSIVGIAALDPQFFKDFLVIEINQAVGVRVEVQGEVVLTKDFATERRIQLSAKDFKMSKQ